MPEDCVWTVGDGTGEEGTMLYLQKMNLEVLQKQVWDSASEAGGG